jgi:hypothetical protein
MASPATPALSDSLPVAPDRPAEPAAAAPRPEDEIVKKAQIHKHKELLLPYLKKVDDLGNAVKDPFNSNGKLGTIGGKVQSLTMWQHYDSYNRNGSITKNKYTTTTLSYLLDYKTPVYNNISGGLQYINVQKLYDGHHVSARNDGYYTMNDKYHIINELYLNYNFSDFNLKKTSLKSGRQIMQYEYFKRNPIRHKEMSAEAMVLTSKDVPNLDFSVGQIRRVSQLTSRTEMPCSYQFSNLGDMVQVPYRTIGATFGQATYTGIPHISVTSYDWLLYDLYNVNGWKIHYAFEFGKLKFTPRTHFAWERDTGRMEKDGLGKVSSYALEFAGTLKYEDFSIEPAVLIISNNERNAVKRFLHPFDTLYAADWIKGGDYNRQFNAGARTFSLRGTYEWHFVKIQSCYYYTYHVKSCVNSSTDRGTRDQQFETDLIFTLTKNLSAKVFMIYGLLGADQYGRKDLGKTDTRLYLTYTF